jgi:hypothetical protein
VWSKWVSPWRSDREIAETKIFGRQVINLMSVAVFIAAGLLLDLTNIGFPLGFYAFGGGACWVASVVLPREDDSAPPDGTGVREPRRPAPQVPRSGVALPRS